jgi:tetratricopeptide (TPR) repeat protein/SAM-dependent methyltransferase
MRRPTRRARSRPRPPGGAATLPGRTSPGAGSADLASLLATAVRHHQNGRFGDAERLYRQVLGQDADHPDALHLLGVLAYQGGQPAVARPLIERALAHRPAAPAYHLNRGNVMLALGRQGEAVASYRRAAELAPADPEAHYNLGNALIQSGQLQDGIAELQRAVQLNPDHADAQYGLGNALRDADRLDEAAAAYAAVTSLRPDCADASTNLGVVLHGLDRHAEARVCFERVVALRPGDPVALVNLAEALRADERLDEAALLYEKVLAVLPESGSALRGLAEVRTAQGRHDNAAGLAGRLVAVTPDDPSAYELHAEILAAAERPEEAFEALAIGVDRHPEHRPLIRALVECLQTVPRVQGGPAVRAALLAALADDTFDPLKLMAAVLRIIWSDPACTALLAAVRAGADPFAAGVPLPATLVDEPVVQAALPRVVLGSPDIERILTALRRFAVSRAAASEPPSLAAQPLSRAFLCALGRASFLVEYSWLLEPDEAGRVTALRATVCDALARPDCDPADLEDLLILVALYEPLSRLPGADRLLAVPESRWGPPFVALVREQVAEWREEQAIAADLPTLTPIDNRVSVLVRSMYEENPYPRWRAARFVGRQSLRDHFRRLCPDEEPPAWPSPAPVLVAGAGTGLHPVDVAMQMPEAAVLAVDLSRTSLAYGARMARQLGVGNVRFAQADILALDALDQRFALIECAGVLHHLEEPLDGWRVLRRLLHPDGLMRLGLYSERARVGVVAARTLIARTRVPPTTEGIQLARRLLLSLPDQHPATGASRLWDFYSMSGFRDLVMHVQEHRFTIPRLAEALDLLDLQFLGFDLRKPKMDRFRARFPEPGAHLDLAYWGRHEAEEPDTFAAMYQFWCRPRR